MSTVDAYQRERLVDALTEELGDRDGDRALAERLTDRLVAEREMAVYVLGGIDRSHAKEYWDERDDRAREAQAERDRLRTGLVQLAAAIETEWFSAWPASLRAAVNQANRLCDERGD